MKSAIVRAVTRQTCRLLAFPLHTACDSLLIARSVKSSNLPCWLSFSEAVSDNFVFYFGHKVDFGVIASCACLATAKNFNEMMLELILQLFHLGLRQFEI